MKSNVKLSMISSKNVGKRTALINKGLKRNLSVLVSLVILLSSFPLGPITISAATVDNFQVIVMDSNDNPVEAANVTFTDETTLSEVTTITGNDGIAIFDVSLEDSDTYTVDIDGGTEYQLYNVTGVTIESGVSYEATLVNLYDITTNASTVTGGTITASQLIGIGSNLDIVITADLGHTIKSVTDNSLAIADTVDGLKSYTYPLTDITMNHSIEVTFAIETRDITVATTTNGKITVNGTTDIANAIETVNYGSDISFTFVPDSGYYLSGIFEGSTLIPFNDTRIVENGDDSYTFTLSQVILDSNIAVTFVPILEGIELETNYYTMSYTGKKNNEYTKPDGTRVFVFENNSTVTFTPKAPTYTKIAINPGKNPSYSTYIDEKSSIFITKIFVKNSSNPVSVNMSPIHVIIDKNEPIINQITKSPNDEWTNGSVTIDIEASDNGESGLYVVRYSSVSTAGDLDTYDSLTEKEADPNNGKYAFTLAGLLPGTYTYYVWAYDYSGNKSEIKTITINIDTDAPTIDTIGIKMPVIPSSGWTNESLTIEGSATDLGGAGLSEIRYSSDPDAFVIDTLGSPSGTTVVPDNGTYSFTVPNTVSFDGTYYVWGYDTAGNKSVAYLSQIVRIDVLIPNSPSVTKDPDPLSGWSQSAVTFTASADDADSPATSGIAGIQCSIKDDFSNAIEMTISADGLTYTYTTPNNEYQDFYYIRSYDNAGNISQTSSIEASIDTQNPTISGFVIEKSNTSVPAKIINFLTFGVFFNESVDVTVTASDAAISSGVSKITLYMLANDGVTETSMDSTLLQNDKYTFELESEFDGTLSAAATDNSGRISAKTSPTQVSDVIKNDRLVLSTTPPEITIIPDAPIFTDAQKYDWYAGDVSFSIQASDDYGLSNVAVTINHVAIDKDMNGKKISSDFSSLQTFSEAFVVNTNQGIIGEAGEYLIEVEVTDVSGNVTKSSATIYKDVTDPVITGIVFSAVDGVEADGSLVEVTDYGYFFLKDTSITISAKDFAPASDVKSITYYTVDFTDSTAGVTSKSKTVEVNSNNQISFNVPANFKGQIYAKVCDNVINTSDYYVKPNGTIVESSEKHAETSNIELSIPETLYKDNNGIELYPNNVNVSVTVADNYSGIKQIDWSVIGAYDNVNNQSGKISIDNGGTATGDVLGWNSTQKDINLITEMTKTITVSNNSNAVKVNVILTDRAGNTSEKNIEISIDKTIPTLQISYNNNSFDTTFEGETQFYKADRTATIVVTERNFDTSRVNLVMENTTGVIPVLSGWSEQKNIADPDLTTHTATILYIADGDYQFDLDLSDRAGLKSADIAVQKFTIDKTIPIVQVSFDNSNVENGNYYNKERTATITIREHNFETSRIVITGTASNDGSTAAYPKASAWSTSGDTHTATLKFSADALYSFDIAYIDKAGNLTEDFTAQGFYVDQTAPAITISGVKDKSANNGDVIPVIEFSDTNFDKDGVTITLSGANRGKVKTDGEFNDINNGRVFTFVNFEKEKNIDDIYTLAASIVDTAGNKTEKTIVFSVNRFGSVYVFDDSLKQIEGKYMQSGIDVIITETNVDELTAKETNLKITKNGVISDLVEGKDYTITHTGGQGEWNIYTYVLSASLFLDDGKYIVSLYSKDSAGNINENIDESKNAEIWFGVDKTLPVILATDLRSNSTYPLSSKTVTTSVSDNLVLSTVQIFLNGEEITYTVENDKYTFEIPSSNISQTVKLLATDSAGNVSTQEINNFYVTTNLFVRWYTNTPLFIGSIAGLVIAIFVLGYVFVYPKSRRRTHK